MTTNIINFPISLTGFQSADLYNNDVHLWSVSLNRNNLYLDNIKDLLDSAEKSKANRFRFQNDHDLYVIAHGFLRLILSLYEGSAPADLQFLEGPFGKLYLVEAAGRKNIMFNISHSGHRVLFAFTRENEIGIDVENIRDDFASRETAEQFFSQREVSIFNTLPKEKQTEAFFNCWTRKEAFIKAVGKGLSYPLKDFDVTLSPGEEPRILNICGQPLEASNWILRDIHLKDGYKGAVAIRAKEMFFKQWGLEQEGVSWIMTKKTLESTGS